MKDNYFFIMSVFLLFLSLLAFSDNLFYDVHQKSNSDPKFVIHGLFMLAWYLIFVVQSWNVKKKNIRRHMALGLVGMAIALGVFLSTLYVFIQVYKGWDQMAFYVKANRFFMLGYGIFIVLAYLQRLNAVNHKRYIFLGSVVILEPILSRVSAKLPVDNVQLIFLVAVWNVIFLSLFVYDYKVLGKIHRITWMSFVLFYLVWIYCIFI